MTHVAIGAIMKQEGPYILEWVYYHKALGFELIIADNGGSDDTSKILTALHEANLITRIDFHFFKTSPQIPAYRAILRLARRKKIDILGFLDCDEFFTRYVPVRSLSPEDGAAHIAAEFDRFKATQITYHWIYYGSKSDYPDTSLPVLQRFSHHSKEQEKCNIEGKSFFRVAERFKLSNIYLLGPKILTPHHYHGAMENWIFDDVKITKNDLYKISISHNNGAVLHYILKTREEYDKKANRGRGDSNAPRYNERFFVKNDYNDINSPIHQRIIDELNAGIEEYKIAIERNYHRMHEQRKIENIRIHLDAIGFSDIQNHPSILYLYKQRKRFLKLFRDH